jgi:hypothetical protein
MESAAFGIFLLIFCGFTTLLAVPIAMAITALIVRRQERTLPSELHTNPALIGLLSFILLMLAACVGLLIWNPTL